MFEWPLLPLCLARYRPRTIIRHSVMKTTTATTPPIKAWSGPCCPKALGSEETRSKWEIYIHIHTHTYSYLWKTTQQCQMIFRITPRCFFFLKCMNKSRKYSQKIPHIRLQNISVDHSNSIMRWDLHSDVLMMVLCSKSWSYGVHSLAPVLLLKIFCFIKQVCVFFF